MADLLNVRQKADDPKLDFMIQVINESLCLNISFDELIISACQNGLIVNALYTELFKCPSSIAQDMWKVG